MHPTAEPPRAAPMRRIALLGVLFVVGILSCGKDVTGPLGAAARYVSGFSWSPKFPPAFDLAGGTSSGVVPFNRVHAVLHHDDGSVALDTIINFPADSTSLTVALTVKLLNDAPTTGESMSLNLGYINAAGDTVFKGGPISIIAAPPPAGGGVNPPVQVPVSYTGTGSNADTVVISTHAVTTVAGSGFQFTAVAKDNTGTTIPGTPIIWSSLDPSLATITSPAAGNGIAQNLRGTARIVAQLLTGHADTAQLTITLPASQIIAQSGNAQTGVVGTALALPLVVKTAAVDGVPVSGVTVTFAVATGGGSVANTSVVSDANGLAQTKWTLGTSTGAQSVTASSGTLTNSPLTFTATANAATATKLVNTTPPANGVAGTPLGPIVFTAEDNNGNVATSFTGPVVVSFGTTSAGATLSGTTTVNAVLGVATFSTLAINKNGAGYTLVATSTLPNDTTAAFNVALGAPNKLVFTAQPANTTTGAAITPAIVVSAEDSQGNLTPSFTGPVALTFATNPSSATLGGTASVNAVLGVATFTGISVSAAGTGYSLSAASTGLTSGTSALFNISSGVATNLILASGGAQTGSINAALGTPVTVMVTDVGGNPVAGKLVTFAVLTGGGSVLPTSGTSNAAGIVQTSWTLGSLVGVQSMSATSAGLVGSPLMITANGTLLGASKTWTGATNNQWTTATNWSPAGVPAATDSITIPVTSNNPQISTSTTIGGLTVQSGATLTLTSAAVTLTDNGAFDATGGILGAGNVVMSAIVGRPIKGIVTAANVTISSTYSLNAAFTVIGNVTIGTGGLLNVNSNVLTISGTFATTGTGILQMATASDGMTVNGNVSFGGGSESGQLTNGLLTVTGNFVQTGGTTSFVAGALHQVVFGGTSAQTVNIANPASATFGKFTTANTAGVTLQTNVVTLSDVTAGGPLAGATVGMTIAGQLIDPSGNTTVAAISFNGSANPIAASTPTVNTNITFNSVSALLANVTVNGGVNVNSASGSISANGHTLTINGSFGTSNSGSLVMGNPADLIIVNGNATFAGNSGAMTGGVLQITGNFTQTTNATAFVASSPHITRFTGATPTISFANPTTSNFGTLQLETTGAVTFATNATTSFDIWLKTGTTPSVTGAVTVSAGRAIYDTTGGRWQVQNTVMTGSATLPRSMTTNVTFAAAGILIDSLKLTGNALISGASALLDLNGHYMKVTGTFGTASGGVLQMVHVNDSLIVKGNASFNGGSTAGKLTSGYFEFDGASFVQGVTPGAFSADTPHVTWFWGLTPQSIAFANPAVTLSHFGNLYLQDTATVLSSNVVLNGQLQTGGQSSFHVEAAADQLVTSNGADLRNIVFDNVRWKTAGTNGNALFPSLDNVIFKNISNTTAAQFDYEYSTKTNLTLAGFTFNTVPTGAGSYITIVGPDTLTMTGVSPALNGGWLSLSGGGAVLGWPNSVMWGGTISTDWNVAGNWSSGVVPTIATDVVVPSGTPFTATTTAASNTHNLTVNTGATVLVNGGTLTVNGDLTVQPSAAVSISGNYAFSVYGNVTTDTAGTTGVTTCNSGQGINLQAGTHTVTGKFCNLSIFGNYTASGPIITTGSAGNGFLQPSGGTGNLTLNGHRVDAMQFWSQSGGTITMTNAADSLLLHGGATGAAYFMGGAETGKMTAGTIVVRSLTFDITGQGIDASGTHTTVIDSAGLQQISWSSPVANHGFNNLIVKSGSTVNVGTSAVTVNGDLTMQPTALLTNNENSQIVVAGNVSTDTATTAGVACSNTYGVNLTGTGKTVKGRFCNLNIFGSYTASGPIVVSGATFGEGELIVSGAGSNLTLNGNNVFTLGFETASSGTLTMTNAADTLSVHTNTLGALFNGGATTGLLTAGTIINKTPTFTATGLGYDASGTHTLVMDTLYSAFQTLTFNSAVPGHGSNNVTMKGTSSKSFSGEQWINGTLLFDATMVGPGNVSGSIPLHVNTLIDNSSGISGGAFQGSTALHITGTTPFNRDTLIVNTLYFDHGQTYSLANNLKTNYVVIDSGSTLVLNGHTLRTGGNSFTTQNGGKLTMTNAVDTLNVAGGSAYFNGGTSTLTAGDFEFQGLFQGYSAPGSPVATASANSFSPTAGLTAHLNSSCCGLMEFLNPGTGPTLSHFWMLQLSTSSTNTLYSNVFVDSLLLGEFSGANAKSDSSAQGVVRTITTKGVYNSGTFGLALQGVSIVLNDGVAASTFFNSVTWTNFPTISSGALFTQNRSSSPPSINFMTYSGVSFSGTGNFALNLGTSSLTLGSSITGGSGACVSAVLTTGNGCH